MDSHNLSADSRSFVQQEISRHPATAGPAFSRAPAVADVMGGIGEEGGSLVLTATLPLSITAAAWATGGNQIRIFSSSTRGDRLEAAYPVAFIESNAVEPTKIVAACNTDDAIWAAPALLTIARAIDSGTLARPAEGFAIALYSDLPADADFGRIAITSAVVLDALCRLHASGIDRATKCRICSDAIHPISETRGQRCIQTAFAGKSGPVLLQTRFAPQLGCETLEMPQGVMVVAAKARLARPTTSQRLTETRICAEMGQRMICDLQRKDGLLRDGMEIRLSSIAPNEYVRRFRDRLPNKITASAFTRQYGELRGLNGDGNGKAFYKIRSRSEHIIYEHGRVQEFASALMKARRGDNSALARAGELMYASHWSHSQRCGIGGVETDKFVNAVRKQGPAAGLFGAKVTGGGEGGELVVLMRSDDRARAALNDAIAEVEAAIGQRIEIYSGSLPGCEYFDAADAAVAPTRMPAASPQPALA